MSFEFATATRVVFGSGERRVVAPEAARLGRHAFVVTGRTPDRTAGLVASLQHEGLTVTSFAIPKEPTTQVVLEAVRRAREAGSDLVVGIGGGSVIDGAKAVAALLANRGDLFDYLEVIGAGRPLTEPPVPCIAVPTTAGTGSEVTRNAVLASPEHRVKVSLRSPLMLPTLAVVDPELTLTTPPSVTAASGLDALTQVLEPFVSSRSNPMTDALCREGLWRAARSLVRAFEDGNDRAAREDMALVSLFGGLALANAGLGAVHGFAGPLGGMFDAPHGALCARLLPPVMAANLHALARRAPDAPTLERYAEVARLLTGRPDARPAEGVAWATDTVNRLGIPRLSAYGMTAAHIPVAVERARRASSMKANPLPLTDDELAAILEQAL